MGFSEKEHDRGTKTRTRYLHNNQNSSMTSEFRYETKKQYQTNHLTQYLDSQINHKTPQIC